MAAPLLTAAALASAIAWGRVPVKDVVIDAPGAASEGELRRAFGVVAGQMLSRSQIRSGVQALLASRAVEDVTVTIEDGDDGAVVHMRAQVSSRVRSFEVVGMPRSVRRIVEGAVAVTVGAPIRVSAFELALVRARESLRDNGYPNARLDPDLQFTVSDGSVAVRVTGSLGAPLVAREVVAPGSGLSPAQAASTTGLQAGARLTAARLEGARRRLAQYLRRDGGWGAEVGAAQVEAGEAWARVVLPVRPGPRYRLDLRGIKRTKGLTAEALPFLRGEESFNDAALDLTLTRVKTYLQRDGRLLARVRGELADDRNGRVLVLDVNAGARTPIVAVAFPGATSVPAAALRERVGARVGHYWRWGGEPVDDDTLAADAASVAGVFRAAGFAEVKLEDPRIVARGNGVAIEFPVVEGPKHVVDALTIDGTPSELQMRPLPLVVGGPWSIDAEEQTRSAVEGTLLEAGYADARVSAAHECAEGKCRVTVRAEAGQGVVIERIVIAGLVKTRRAVVEKVAGLREGSVIGPEEQLAAQRRLLGLGIFQGANLRPIPGQTSGTRRGLLLDLDEAPSRAFSFGLGWATAENARVSASWSELNLFGSARSLSVEVRASSREQRFQISYREPARLGLLGFPTAVSIYRTEEHLATFDLLRRGTWIEFGDRRQRPTRVILRYEYQIVDPTAPDNILSQLERDKQRLRIASVTPIVEWDTRDDIFSPRRGVYASAQLQSAFKVFLADAAFDAVTLSFSAFHPAGSGVVAAAIRAGGISPRDRVADTTDNLMLPINVRFFAGGRISHRAFETDRLGIPGQTLDSAGKPVGGAGIVLTNLEWRFPIVGSVGGSVFVDGGNVWAAWRDVRSSDLRWGAGLGVRVETPVGPLRLEYGWKLDRKAGESPGQLFLSFGNPF